METSNNKPTPNRSTLNWIVLAFIMVAAVASIRSLPAMAVYGLGSILLYLIPCIVFFIPVSLVAGELGTGWNGGLYGWTKNAFGERWGFFISWFMWAQVMTWYPIVLAFVASTFAFLIGKPELASSGLFTAVVIVVFYWFSTLLALRGINAVSKLSSWFMIVGTLTPAAVLFVLGAIWLIMGKPTACTMSFEALIPTLLTPAQETQIHHGHIGLWKETGILVAGLVLIVSNFLAFAGIEMNAFHVRRLAKPQAMFPKALVVAFFMILFIFIPTTLAISFVVPADSTSLTAGVAQAYDTFFQKFGIPWATPILCIMLIFGALGGVLTWTAGPSTGLLFVGKGGNLPAWFQKTNANGVQKNILLVQAIGVSILAVAYIIIPDVSTAFWMLSAMAALIYLIIYLFMFSSALKLRKSQPAVKRGFHCPALHFWATLGIIATIIALVLGCIPPSQYASSMGTGVYVSILAIGVIILAIPPFIIYALRKPSWKTLSDEEAAKYSAALQDLKDSD